MSSRHGDPDDDAGTVRIRHAEQADVLSVFRIEKRCFPQPWPFASFERFLDEPGFLVAVDDEGSVLGYVVADVTPNYGRDLGHVKDIAVHPDYQGRGIGTRLLTRGLETLAGQGASVVKLEVRESNAGARKLYREFGFDAMRSVPGYYADGEAAVVMTLAVEEWQRDRETRRSPGVQAAGDTDL